MSSRSRTWTRTLALAGVAVIAGAALIGAACGGTSSADKTSTAVAKGGASTPAAAPTTAATKAAPTVASTSASGTPAASGTAAGATGTLALATKSTTIGTVLVNGAGRTLYLFKNDTAGNGKSACNGGCAGLWPPATSSDLPTAPAGATGTLTLITRDDGTKQAAYNGLPLYTFAQDTAPGDTKGDGFANGLWSAAKP